MRILLIEDDHLLANTMLGMLRDEQNTVDWLDDGQQALNALLNDSFDLAILDLRSISIGFPTVKICDSWANFFSRCAEVRASLIHFYFEFFLRIKSKSPGIV